MNLYFELYNKIQEQDYDNCIELILDQAVKLNIEEKAFLFSFVLYYITDVIKLEKIVYQLQQKLDTRDEFLIDFRQVDEFFEQKQYFKEKQNILKQKILNILSYSNIHFLVLLKTKFTEDIGKNQDQLLYCMYEDQIFRSWLQQQRINCLDISNNYYPYNNFDRFYKECQQNKKEYNVSSQNENCYLKNDKQSLYHILYNPSKIFDQYNTAQMTSLNSIFQSQFISEEFKIIFLIKNIFKLKKNFYRYGKLFLKQFTSIYFMFACIFVTTKKLQLVDVWTFFLKYLKEFYDDQYINFDNIYYIQDFFLSNNTDIQITLPQYIDIQSKDIKNQMNLYLFRQVQNFLNKNNQPEMAKENYQLNLQYFKYDVDFWMAQFFEKNNQEQYVQENHKDFDEDQHITDLIKKAQKNGVNFERDQIDIKKYENRKREQLKLYCYFDKELQRKINFDPKYSVNKSKKIQKQKQKDNKNILPSFFNEKPKPKQNFENQLGFFTNSKSPITFKILNFPRGRNSQDFENFLQQFGLDEYSNIKLPNSKRKSWMCQTQNFASAKQFMKNLQLKKYEGQKIKVNIIKQN